MIGFDTNILLRYIIADDEKQLKVSRRLIEALSSTDQAYVSLVVLSELYWGMAKVYKMPKKKVLLALEYILSFDGFVVENPDLCVRAYKSYETGKADFTDYMIQERSAGAGCQHLVTFDKKAAKEKGFKLAA